MRKPNLLLRLTLLAVLFVPALVSLRPAAARQTATETGTQQTPIDIRDEDLTFVEHLPALGFSYGTKVALDVLNTGSPGEFDTIRAIVPAGGGQLTVAGDPAVTYPLKQFHWHAPSEHALNGQKFPMEMHLVHKTDDGRVTVVGIFVRSGKENKELGKIFADLPQQPGELRSVGRFNLTKLLPHGLESYRYTGSLTTPNFDEGVNWIVLARPIEMSPAQIEAFRQLFPEGNSREIQPLNGRTIQTDVEREND